MTDIALRTFTTTGMCNQGDGMQNGTIVTSASTVITDDLGVAREGDMVVADCGHVGYIDPPGTSYVVEDKPVARLGDSFSGDYEGTIDLDQSSTVETA